MKGILAYKAKPAHPSRTRRLILKGKFIIEKVSIIILSIMNIQEIIFAVQGKRIRITDHADEEVLSDHLTFDEIFFSVLQGEIIEDYPTDKPYPSCLIYGDNFHGEPIHSVWAYNQETKWTVLITVYRPDPNRWVNWRKRRK